MIKKHKEKRIERRLMMKTFNIVLGILAMLPNPALAVGSSISSTTEEALISTAAEVNKERSLRGSDKVKKEVLQDKAIDNYYEVNQELEKVSYDEGDSHRDNYEKVSDEDYSYELNLEDKEVDGEFSKLNVEETDQFQEDPHTTLLFPKNNQCDKNINLCEDGTNCSGLKQVFLELCYKQEEKMTDCTSDCSYLFAQLEMEATRQGKAIECVDYVQNLPLLCAERNYDDENLFESLYCQSENDFTIDLQPGDIESISCTDLYPSGIFGTGSTYRYCMLGGDAIVTNNCEMVKENNISSRRLSGALQPIAHRSLSNEEEFRKVADLTNTILIDTSTTLKNAGDAMELLESVGKLSKQLLPAFQAIGIVFDLVNFFTGKPESAELVFMKDQFKIVNEKLDLMADQLTDVEERLTYEIIKSQYEIFTSKLSTCSIFLKTFQASPSMGTNRAFTQNCCHGDRIPIVFLHWMSNNVLEYLSSIIKAKAYKMDTIVYETAGIVHSTTMASYIHATCTGLTGIEDETARNNQIQDGVDHHNLVLNRVTEKIKALPNDYINIQLRDDVVHVVRTTTNTDDCARELHNIISDKMKGWRYRPRVGTYCYDPVTGWKHHGVHSKNFKNELAGFFYEFRIDSKFSVGVDWTFRKHEIDTDLIKRSIMGKLTRLQPTYEIGSYGSFGLNLLRRIVQDELNQTYCVGLRNIAYVGFGNRARKRTYYGYQYWINIKVPEYNINHKNEYDLSEYHSYSVFFSVYPWLVCEGTSVQCFKNSPTGDQRTVYRVTNGKLRGYQNPVIASSWDSDWRSTMRKMDCTGLESGPDMPQKPDEGASVQCSRNSPTGDQRSVYRVTNGKLRGYQNPVIASSWDSDWRSTMKKIDCTGLESGPDMPQKPDEGASVQCSRNSPTGDQRSVYRMTNGKLRSYQNPVIASSWDSDWRSTMKKIDCTGLESGPDMSFKNSR